MNARLFALAVLLLGSVAGFSQNSMGVGTDTPNPNAVLELVSPTNNQGFLVPRLTTAQRTDVAFTGNLTAADNGLMIFDSDESQFYFWVDGSWQAVVNQGVANSDSAIYADTAFYAFESVVSQFSDSSLFADVAIYADSALFADESSNSLFSDTSAFANQSEFSSNADTALFALSTFPVNFADTAGYVAVADSIPGLSTDGTNIGIGTTNPLSPLQIDNKFHLYHWQYSPTGFEGEIIADNLHPGVDSLYYTNEDYGSFIFMNRGDIEFLHADSLPAGTDAVSTGAVNGSLVLKKSRHAEFSGAVELGPIRDSLDLSSGAIYFDLGDAWVFDGIEHRKLGGLSFPFGEVVIEDGTYPFSIVNQGTGGGAYFNVDNTSAFNNALWLRNSSLDANSRGIRVDHTGAGNAGEFNITGAQGSATQYAVFGSTDGLGSAGRFEINNASNNSSAVLGRIDAGGGNAIEGYTLGLGPAGRFTNANPANGSITLSVNNSGTNSVALFQNTATATSSAVEIVNNGSGAGLTIQSTAGTTRFGDDALIAGPMTTTGAVYSNTRTINGTGSILDNDHIVHITAGTNSTITLPDASLHEGRELIINDSSGGGITNTITSVAVNDFVFQGSLQANLTSGSGVAISVIILRAIAGNWVVLATVPWPV